MTAYRLRQKAEQFRWMMRLITDRLAVHTLRELSDELEMTADQMERRQGIRQRAYALWIAQGRPEGRDVENWLAAEREFDEETSTPRQPRALRRIGQPA